MNTTTNTSPKTQKTTPPQPTKAKTPDGKDDNWVELGALWAKESKAGKEYFTGDVTVNGVQEQIIVTRNNFKTVEKQPDWRIYRRDLDAVGAPKTSPLKTKTVKRENTATKPVNLPVEAATESEFDAPPTEEGFETLA